MVSGPNESALVCQRRRQELRPSGSVASSVQTPQEPLETILHWVSPSLPVVKHPNGACASFPGVESQLVPSRQPRVLQQGVSGQDPSFLCPLLAPASPSPQ